MSPDVKAALGSGLLFKQEGGDVPIGEARGPLIRNLVGTHGGYFSAEVLHEPQVGAGLIGLSIQNRPAVGRSCNRIRDRSGYR